MTAQLTETFGLTYPIHVGGDRHRRLSSGSASAVPAIVPVSAKTQPLQGQQPRRRIAEVVKWDSIYEETKMTEKLTDV
jgi:hypothetical protein